MLTPTSLGFLSAFILREKWQKKTNPQNPLSLLSTFFGVLQTQGCPSVSPAIQTMTFGSDASEYEGNIPRVSSKKRPLFIHRRMPSISLLR